MKKTGIFLAVGILFTFLSMPFATAKNKPSSYLSRINPSYMVTPTEAYDWHLLKDSAGPTYAGSPAWNTFLNFLESKLEEYGVVGLIKNRWTYDRWFTSDWPNDSNWILLSDSKEIRVAHYGAYSGSTDENGITAQLVFYDPGAPPASIEGKIVVFKTAPHPQPPLDPAYEAFFTLNDYEYITDPETFPPIHTQVPVSESISYDVWYQLRQTAGFISILNSGKALGGIFVFDASYDRLAGLYTFGVPTLYNIPTLFLDRDAGDEVINDAKDGKVANIKLLADIDPTETYQLIGCLPGKNYGTPADERILLRTHTDGPAMSQDNGAFGILGIIHYFSNIPQAERPRTLMVFLDNRHYMPGMETAFADQDWFAQNPSEWNSIVAVMGIEHLGQIEYREVVDVFEPSGQVEPSFLWVQNNQALIDMAIKSVLDNDWPRVAVQCVDRPGIHGEQQGVWYGMGAIARSLGLPAFATMGTQGAYWATTAGIDQFDEDLFCTQVAAMSQLVGELMLADLVVVNPFWGTFRTQVAALQNEAFSNPELSIQQKNTLLNKLDAVFNQVKSGAKGATVKLQNDVKGKVENWITEPYRTELLDKIDFALQLLTN